MSAITRSFSYPDAIFPYIGDNGNWWLNGVDTGFTSQGADGADGQDGADGADGADGQDGADGADGQDGKDGVDGAGITSIDYVDGVITITLSDGTKESFTLSVNSDGTLIGVVDCLSDDSPMMLSTLKSGDMKIMEFTYDDQNRLAYAAYNQIENNAATPFVQMIREYESATSNNSTTTIYQEAQYDGQTIDYGVQYSYVPYTMITERELCTKYTTSELLDIIAPNGVKLITQRTDIEANDPDETYIKVSDVITGTYIGTSTATFLDVHEAVIDAEIRESANYLFYILQGSYSDEQLYYYDYASEMITIVDVSYWNDGFTSDESYGYARVRKFPKSYYPSNYYGGDTQDLEVIDYNNTVYAKQLETYEDWISSVEGLDLPGYVRIYHDSAEYREEPAAGYEETWGYGSLTILKSIDQMMAFLPYPETKYYYQEVDRVASSTSLFSLSGTYDGFSEYERRFKYGYNGYWSYSDDVESYVQYGSANYYTTSGTTANSYLYLDKSRYQKYRVYDKGTIMTAGRYTLAEDNGYYLGTLEGCNTESDTYGDYTTSDGVLIYIMNGDKLDRIELCEAQDNVSSGGSSSSGGGLTDSVEDSDSDGVSDLVIATPTVDGDDDADVIISRASNDDVTSSTTTYEMEVYLQFVYVDDKLSSVIVGDCDGTTYEGLFSIEYDDNNNPIQIDVYGEEIEALNSSSMNDFMTALGVASKYTTLDTTTGEYKVSYSYNVTSATPLLKATYNYDYKNFFGNTLGALNILPFGLTMENAPEEIMWAGHSSFLFTEYSGFNSAGYPTSAKTTVNFGAGDILGYGSVTIGGVSVSAAFDYVDKK